MPDLTLKEFREIRKNPTRLAKFKKNMIGLVLDNCRVFIWQSDDGKRRSFTVHPPKGKKSEDGDEDDEKQESN